MSTGLNMFADNWWGLTLTIPHCDCYKRQNACTQHKNGVHMLQWTEGGWDEFTVAELCLKSNLNCEFFHSLRLM